MMVMHPHATGSDRGRHRTDLSMSAF